MNTDMLATLGLTKEDILNRAAEKVLEGFDRDYDDADIVTSKVLKELRDKRDAMIEQRVEQKVEAFMLEHIDKQLGLMVQPTDGFGNPKGEPSTLAEMILAYGKAYLEARVDHDGKEVARNNYGYGDSKTRFHWLVAKASENKISSAVTKLVQDEQKRWADLASALVAEALKNASVAIRTR